MLDSEVTMNRNDQAIVSALQVFQPANDAVYSIESVVHIAHTDRHRIAVYCRHGLISPVAPPEREGWRFDRDAIRRLVKYEYLAGEYGLGLDGVKLVAQLLGEIEMLRDRLQDSSDRPRF